MPTSNPYGVGASLNAAAFATRRHDIAITVDGGVGSLELLCPGMPRLAFWINQAIGVAVTVQPQFMVRAITGVGTPDDEWLALCPPITLALGVITLVNFEIVAVKTRLLITRVPLSGQQDIQYVLTCTA